MCLEEYFLRLAYPLDFCSPLAIPHEVSKYETHSKHLVTEKPFNAGLLQMKLERASMNQKTVITRQYCKVPLLIQRPLYLEESLPAMAFVYILSPSGGILQGDRYRIDITLSNNALAHITTQGATRIYKMQNNIGTQMINFVQEEGTYLEYIPDQIIPYSNSRFYQIVQINIHDKATMIYSELIVPGRVASGESFKYDICYVKTIARNQTGKLRFIDVIKLQPKIENLKAGSMIGPLDVLGTVYILTDTVYVHHIQAEINSIIAELQDAVSGGASILPENKGVIVRLLGKTAEELRNVIFRIVAVSRMQIIGASFTDIRKP
jgi:urease accessory protein